MTPSTRIKLPDSASPLDAELVQVMQRVARAMLVHSSDERAKVDALTALWRDGVAVLERMRRAAGRRTPAVRQSAEVNT